MVHDVGLARDILGMRRRTAGVGQVQIDKQSKVRSESDISSREFLGHLKDPKPIHRSQEVKLGIPEFC